MTTEKEEIPWTIIAIVVLVIALVWSNWGRIFSGTSVSTKSAEAIVDGEQKGPPTSSATARYEAAIYGTGGSAKVAAEIPAIETQPEIKLTNPVDLARQKQAVAAINAGTSYLEARSVRLQQEEQTKAEILRVEETQAVVDQVRISNWETVQKPGTIADRIATRAATPIVVLPKGLKKMEKGDPRVTAQYNKTKKQWEDLDGNVIPAPPTPPAAK